MGCRPGSRAAEAVSGVTVAPPEQGKVEQGKRKGSSATVQQGKGKLDNGVQTEWQRVRSRQGLHKKGFNEGGEDERAVIRCLREVPVPAAWRALASLDAGTFEAGEDIRARVLATFRKEAAAEPGWQGSAHPQPANGHAKGHSSSSTALAESAAAQRKAPGGGRAEAGWEAVPSSGGADGWQVQGKSGRTKPGDGSQAQSRSGRQDRPGLEEVRSAGVGASYVLTVPRSSSAPAAKGLEGSAQQQQQQQRESSSAGHREAAQQECQQPQPAALQPRARLLLDRLAPEVDARWQTLCKLAKLDSDQRASGLRCLLRTVPSIAVRTLDSMNRHLRTNQIKEPSSYALKALIESRDFLTADAIAPAVEELARKLCAALGIPRQALDPRVDHILASQPESFGRQVLHALMHKDWTGTREPTSYIVSTLTVHAKNAAIIAALPEGAMQLPPSLKKGLEKLCSVAGVEEWQLDPRCTLVLLEMPPELAADRLRYMATHRWKVMADPKPMFPCLETESAFLAPARRSHEKRKASPTRPLRVPSWPAEES